YGFGGLPGCLVTDQRLQDYLRRPLILYFGTADTARDEELDTRPDADRQGRHRLERGRHAFRAAEQLATRRGWELGWRLVEAPGVGHDHEAVFDSAACSDVLVGSVGST